MTTLPIGFTALGANLGVKDDSLDFAVVAADRTCPAAAVFTQSRFAGASVVRSRGHVADGRLRAVAVVSKNANVATGPDGDEHAAELARRTAALVGCEPTDVLVASTGTIGRPYPPAIFDRLTALDPPADTAVDRFAEAIMTTDTHPKTATATLPTTTLPTVDGANGGNGATTIDSRARIVGVAKGVGMIEPNMATMLAFVFTDAAVDGDDLDAVFRRVVDRTFNCLSVDTDTSTSDTAAVLASGHAGAVDLDAFEAALHDVCLDLTRQLAADGEGAETLIVVTVDEAGTDARAKRAAKVIVNSPLVKTAVHGADPNWGRIAMALGKLEDDEAIVPEKVTIRIGDQELYPTLVDDATLGRLSEYLAGDEVLIHVSLGLAAEPTETTEDGTQTGTATVYGCDLTDGYVRINADYTT